MTVILSTWSHRADDTTPVVVLPDGCRDLIHLREAGKAPAWFVSPLADTAHEIACVAGARYTGFRFHPAARFDEHGLVTAVASRPDDADEGDVQAVLGDLIRLDDRLAEALGGLAEATSVSAAAHLLGVSERSLERVVRAGTGRPPSHWRGLARIRRAAAALAGPEPLAEIAAAHGFADQAHMSRAFRAWFATTPTAFRRDPELLQIAAEPGYA